MARKSMISAFVVVGMALAVGCGVDGGKVNGDLDDVKYVKAVTEKSHYVTVAKTKRECSARDKKNRCTSYRTVSDGTMRKKVVDRKGLPAMYCVELDNVAGESTDDDQWYEVPFSEYSDHAGEDEGTPVKEMEYYRKLSSCTR